MKITHLLATLTAFAALAFSNLRAAGPYPFKDGFPTSEAAKSALDDADYQRAVTAYTSSISSVISLAIPPQSPLAAFSLRRVHVSPQPCASSMRT